MSERPQTPQERSASLARAKELAAKEELTAEELKDFVYAIWAVSDTNGLDSEHGDRFFPSGENRRFLLWKSSRSDNDGDYVQVNILDGITPDSGEIFVLDEKKGELFWTTGIFDSFYSEFLGRREKLFFPGKDSLKSETPLNPQECARLAKTLWEAYPKQA